jgi:hypothetical protein
VTRNRGQLVVLAAVALALALVPMTLAYLQLGYDGDVEATTVTADSTRDIEGTLQRALVDATAEVPARHDWENRSAAAQSVRNRLQPTIHSATTTSVDSDRAVTVSPNDTRASAWARATCPGGPAREFGACQSNGGLIVQERAGRTHVLALAVDVTVTTDDTERSSTMVLTVPS